MNILKTLTATLMVILFLPAIYSCATERYLKIEQAKTIEISGAEVKITALFSHPKVTHF